MLKINLTESFSQLNKVPSKITKQHTRSSIFNRQLLSPLFIIYVNDQILKDIPSRKLCSCCQIGECLPNSLFEFSFFIPLSVVFLLSDLLEIAKVG